MLLTSMLISHPSTLCTWRKCLYLWSKKGPLQLLQLPWYGTELLLGKGSQFVTHCYFPLGLNGSWSQNWLSYFTSYFHRLDCTLWANPSHPLLPPLTCAPGCLRCGCVLLGLPRLCHNDSLPGNSSRRRQVWEPTQPGTAAQHAGGTAVIRSSVLGVWLLLNNKTPHEILPHRVWFQIGPITVLLKDCFYFRNEDQMYITCRYEDIRHTKITNYYILPKSIVQSAVHCHMPWKALKVIDSDGLLSVLVLGAIVIRNYAS